MKKIIQESRFNEEFENINASKTFLLDNEESGLIWVKYIDAVAQSYFSLPDDHWIVKNESYFICNWLSAYNAMDIQAVREILDIHINWQNTDVIWFCLRKIEVIETTWKEFKDFWINFLMCEDACPILINSNDPVNTILFRPIGDCVKLRRNSNG